MIFYTIYKNQGNHFTIGVTLLQGSPRKESFFCNVAPGGGRKRELVVAGLDGDGGSSGADGAVWCAGGEGQRRLYRGRADLLATIGLAGTRLGTRAPDDREGTAGP
jgi:hypothetical protein